MDTPATDSTESTLATGTVEATDTAASPRVAAIADVLSDRVRSGAYRDGHWFPAERDIVAEFGVSRGTVRRVMDALEGRALIRRSPRCRPVVVQPAARGPEPAPRATARQTLGLWIWPGPADPAASSIVQGICGALDDAAYRLVVGHASGESWREVFASESQFLERMATDRDIAGVLIWCLGGEHSLPGLTRLREAGVPLVFLDRRPPSGFEADFVGLDNEHAAAEVVRHLIAQGHCRIAHITNVDPVSTVADRLAGYRRALEEAGIPFDSELVLRETVQRGGDMDVYDALIDRLLTMPDRPTAAFAVNDHLALHLLASARMRGVAVPEALALAGFDGNERWIPGPRFLTTADQPFQRIGRRAAELLVRRIETDPAAPTLHVLMDAPLSIRGSTTVR